MRKIISSFVALVFMVLSLNSLADGDDPNLDLIHARQGEMELRAYNLGPLVAMAKGEIPYDAKMAANLAKNLQLLLQLDMGRAWAPDTGNDKYAGKTAALPEIWSTYPKISERGKKYAAAVKTLAGSAGNGLNELRANLGGVGDACKACHDDFQEKK